jgi:hypothetical protein
VTVSRRRTPLLARLIVVVATLLALGSSGPPPAAAAVTAEGDGVTVTVPVISYAPRDDLFRVGPFRSRLDVLSNDSGLPAPERLQLLDRRGIPTTTVTVPRLARLRVVAGYVVLDPMPRARGHLSFTYRAASPNGPAANGHAVVALFPRVIVARNDQATTRQHTQVVVDVAANDRLVVSGAVIACGPHLFAHPPRRPDPLLLVLPEPDRRPVDCAGRHRTQRLTTAQGAWRIDAQGRVAFHPAAGFTGTARAYYRQASAHPFDLGLASVSVSVRHRGSGVLGTEQDGEGGAPGGSLAATGAAVALLALVAGSLVYVGLLLVRAARRHRQPVDLEA